MPARTNEFQQLVALIEKSLSPRAKVTESAMVAVAGMSEPREVDILIEDNAGPYHIKIAAETKNESRRLDVTTVEQLISKYRGECSVHVNKLVIVSPKGFTKGAIEKAAAADVELLTIEQAKHKNWNSEGSGRIQFKAAPHLHKIYTSPAPSVVDPQFAYKHGQLTCRHGHDHGTLAAMARCLFFHKWLPKNEKTYREMEKKIQDDHNGNGFVNVWTPMPKLKLRLGGVDHPIEKLHFSVHIVNQEGKLTHNTYERRSTMSDTKVVHHLKGTAGDAQLEVMFRQGEPVRITHPPGTPIGQRPSDQQLREAIRSVFPDGLTFKLSKATRPGVGKAAKAKKPKESPSRKRTPTKRKTKKK